MSFFNAIPGIFGFFVNILMFEGEIKQLWLQPESLMVWLKKSKPKHNYLPLPT